MSYNWIKCPKCGRGGPNEDEGVGVREDAFVGILSPEESGRDDGKSIFVVEYCAVCVDCWWQLKREETEVI